MLIEENEDTASFETSGGVLTLVTVLSAPFQKDM